VVSSERHGVQAGEFHRFRIRASDPDGDKLTYRVTGLPRTASFDPNQGTISWRPARTEVGQHAFRIQVHDGTLAADALLEVEVTDAEQALGDAEWSAWLVPGLGYSLYRPRRKSTGQTLRVGVAIIDSGCHIRFKIFNSELSGSATLELVVMGGAEVAIAPGFAS
jgi:hypothetical protein